jgi:cytosine/adenosine deaminase-related metal-dependent hydrolase
MTMTADRLLLRRGCVIDTEPRIIVRPETDVLVEDGRITAAGPDLRDAEATVLDATDRIVLPGFVDTHRHTWQAVLRSVAVDADLGAYVSKVLDWFAPRFRAADVRTANLAGALECLDAGITTLQDFSSIQYTPDHTDAAVSGLLSAGIRAVFGYGYAHWSTPAEVSRIRDRYFGSDDQLITMALAPPGPSYSRAGDVRADWRLARELGLRIAIHLGAGRGPVRLLRDQGLLGDDILFVHGNTLGDDELGLIAGCGAGMSIAPAVEAQMGHGPPLVGRVLRSGISCGFGVDVVPTVAGDMFSVMRAAMLTGRQGDGTPVTAADVLRMATLGGAAALGMADVIGSLRPGKRADIVVLRTDTLNMAGLHDPVGAVVSAAHPGNVEAVLVDGHLVKRDGRLVRPDLDAVIRAARDCARYLAAAR